MTYISLVEYAKKHGRTHATVYQKYQAGGFVTAQKIGRTVVIDEDEPYTMQRKARVSCADSNTDVSNADDN